MKRLVGTVFVLLGFAAMTIAGPVKVRQGVFTHTIDTTGDAQQIIGFTPSSAVDDMVYADSFLVAGGGIGDTIAATWTAPSAATDVAMICDSMVAYINAAGAGIYFASDSTTYFAVALLDAGLGWAIVGTDSTQDEAADTSLLQAVATSSSTDSATISLFSMQYPEEYSAMYGDIILQAANSEDNGYGLSLVATVVLNKYFQGASTMIDSAYGTSLPLKLSPRWGKDTVGGGVDLDTMWGEYLEVRVTVADSTTVTGSYDHKVDTYIIPRK